LEGIDEEERLFKIAYFKYLLALQNNKQTLMSQYQMTINMFENSNTYQLDQSITNNNVLIFQAKDDQSFDLDEQATLRQTYPNANVHLFEEGGHAAVLKHQEEYYKVLLGFMKSR
jgi:homoserine acetyltransferase